jgi:hypothetical protein
MLWEVAGDLSAAELGRESAQKVRQVRHSCSKLDRDDVAVGLQMGANEEFLCGIPLFIQVCKEHICV